MMQSSTSPPTAPYFPPPPRYASTTKSKSKKDSLRTSKESSPTRPFILRRSRQFLLPTLLILTFTNTILSMIYAYCIAAPHTRLTSEDFAKDPNTELDDSFFKRAAGLVRRASSHATDGSPDVAMVAYTLSAPLATLVYIMIELTLHIVRPHVSITRRTHQAFLLCVAVLAAGWTTTNALWTHCEMPAPSLTANMRMCPVSVRGHFMFGIHELSIAKVIVGWFIVIGLLVHMFCLVKNMRDIRRYGGDGLGIQHGSVRMVLEMEEGARVQKGLRRSYKKQGVRIAEGY